MEVREKILIIDDEKSIRNFMRAALTANDYNVLCASSAAEGLAMIRSHHPELVILDLGLPDTDGMQVLKSVRMQNSTPIIVVSARSLESDKVAALDAGADDYLTKPFGTSELLARIRTALRHSRSALQNSGILQGGRIKVGDLVIDHNKHRVFLGEKDVGLTQNEFRLVALLGKYAGRVLTYDFIIKEFWGDTPKNDNRILRVNMANIRRKIEKNPAEPEYIFTEVGVGYRMRDPE